MKNLLLSMIGLNLLGISVLACLPNNLNKIYRVFTLGLTNCLFMLSLLIWLKFNKNTLSFQYFGGFSWFFDFDVHLFFGVDGISIFFLLLTTLIFPFCVLASWKLENSKALILNLLLIELFLILTFTVLDLFLFCVFFESLLIPIFFIIVSWGNRERRVKALSYFFLYTLFGSIFLLAALFILFSELQSTSFYAIMFHSISNEKQLIIWALLFLVFAIKIPIFPFHIWLPEAHVEAPTVGSVLLAGLLLKLGGYGILRFLFLFEYARFYFQPLVLTLCLLSIFFASIMALRQLDIKRIIAYSSIAHINFALLGYFSNSIYGIMGGTLLMVSHGIVSSALFLLIGVLYDRYHSRAVYCYGGLVQVIPLFAFFFFFFTISNFSFPGTSNFVGELFVLIGLGQAAQKIILILAAFSTLFGLIYSILLFNRIVFGNLNTKYIRTFSDMSRRETYILAPLLFLNVLIGVVPTPITTTCYMALKNLVRGVERDGVWQNTVITRNPDSIFFTFLYNSNNLHTVYTIVPPEAIVSVETSGNYFCEEAFPFQVKELFISLEPSFFISLHHGNDVSMDVRAHDLNVKVGAPGSTTWFPVSDLSKYSFDRPINFGADFTKPDNY